MKSVIESNKKYIFWDFLRIPLSICPICSLLKVFNVVLAALIPSFQVLLTADFVDTAMAIFAGTKAQTDIFSPLFLLMATVGYSGLNPQLISFVDLRFEMKLTQVYRSAMAEKRARLAYRHIENADSWDLITRTCTDPVTKLKEGFDSCLDAASIVIRVFSLLLILLAQVWWAGAVIVTASIPLFWLSLKGGKATYQASVEAQKFSRRAAYLQKVLSDRENVEERSLFGYTDAVNQMWYEKYETSRKINLKVRLKYFIRMKGSSLITVALSMFIMAVLLFPLSHGQITIGMFMGLITTTLDLVHVMSWSLSNAMESLAKNREYLKDLTAFCALEEAPGSLDMPCDISALPLESIEFRDVSFCYPGTDRFILRHFNLRLENGLHYAIVGINGAGKTTITKLLTGLYDNYDGEILINGRSIREYSQAQLKAMFAVVYQDFARYFVSMRDNIALGNVLSADEEKIRKSASNAGLDEAISQKTAGLDSILGKIKQNGVDLSGGQWQKVAIARALYNPANVRILDEPTAALDPIAESNVYEMFGRVSAGKTTIFITHRLGAARLADRIVVIQEGKVAEEGSHEQLLARKGIYAEMFDAQRSWYQ